MLVNEAQHLLPVLTIAECLSVSEKGFVPSVSIVHTGQILIRLLLGSDLEDIRHIGTDTEVVDIPCHTITTDCHATGIGLHGVLLDLEGQLAYPIMTPGKPDRFLEPEMCAPLRPDHLGLDTEFLYHGLDGCLREMVDIDHHFIVRDQFPAAVEGCNILGEFSLVDLAGVFLTVLVFDKHGFLLFHMGLCCTIRVTKRDRDNAVIILVSYP